jgi:hypothetical protein
MVRISDIIHLQRRVFCKRFVNRNTTDWGMMSDWYILRAPTVYIRTCILSSNRSFAVAHFDISSKLPEKCQYFVSMEAYHLRRISSWQSP